MISGKTRYYAILGNPIEQALSPIVQNAAFEAEKIDAVFLGCRVAPGKLREAVEGTRALNFAGLAVTMPFKREIIPYLDSVSDKARILDAVNVVTIEEGHYRGYNTDGDGFVQDLLQQQIRVDGQNIVMFGAGGAARGIALSLLETGAKQLYLCNIYPKEAEDVINMLVNCGYRNVEYLPFEKETIRERVSQFGLWINATCLGMTGIASSHVDLVPWEDLNREAVFADIVHKPLMTDFLIKADKTKHRIVTGDGMLLHQGILAYQLLTEKDAPARTMQDQLKEWLHQEQKR